MFNRWKGERLIDRAHDLWNNSGEFARTGATEANGFIHRRPLAATLISVGAGLCFGMFYASLSHGSESEQAPPPRSRASTKATKSRRR